MAFKLGSAGARFAVSRYPSEVLNNGIPRFGGNQFARLVAISGGVLLTVLALRNPLSPNWLRTEFVAQAAALVLTAGVCAAISNAMVGLIDANIQYSVAAILTGAIFAASSYVLWKAFNIGGRLKRTESGRSPFARERPQLKSQAAVALEQSA